MTLYHGSNVTVENPNIGLSRENLDFGAGFYTTENPFDLIIGPVANDDVFATLIIYEQGILSVEQTLEALKIKELYGQFVFKTEKALSFLHYINSFDSEAHL